MFCNKRKTNLQFNFAALCILAVMLLAVILSVAFWKVSVAYADNGEFGGGDGTESSPYRITSDEHLQLLSTNVQGGGVNGYLGQYFILENDIDLTNVSQGSISGWMPIGTVMYPFRGTFLGNDKTVSGIVINRISDNIGFFGVTGEEAVVKDLTVSGEIRGGTYTGGVVGYNRGTVENVRNYINITTMLTSAVDTGGVIGHNLGILKGAANYGTVLNTSFNAGGLVGTNNGQVIKAFNVGVVQGVTNVGGVAGENGREGKISETFNNGDVIVSGSFAGGIVGDNKGDLTYSYNAATIHANAIAADYFGGLAGNNDGSNSSNGTICKCYNIGTTDNVSFFGNISAFNTGVIEDCYYSKEINSADVTNGMYAVNTVGLDNKSMLDADVFENIDKMSLLKNEDIWQRREFENEYVFFPELKEFIGLPESKESVKFSRVLKQTEDVELDETVFVYNGEPHETDIYLGNLKLIKDLDYIILSNSVNAEGENGSSITISFINYYKGTATKQFTINKSVLITSWSGESLYYNGAPQHHTIIIESGRAGDEDVTFLYEYNSGINAGTYTVTAKLADTSINSNYYFEPKSHEYVICKNPLTVSWSTETLIYSGAPQYHTILIESGRIGEEEIDFCYEFDGCVNAGGYSVKGYLADTITNKNYELQPQTHTFEIEKKGLAVNWNLDALVYNGQVQFPAASVSGTVNDEKVTLIYSDYENNIAAQSGYEVTVALEDNKCNSNYVLVGELNHGYSIEKSVLIIEWDEEPLRYNGNAQKPSFKIVGGQVDGENIEFVYSDYSENIFVGTNYAVAVELSPAGVNQNYNFTAQVKAYSIEKALITIAWETGDLFYNGQVQRPTAKITSTVYDSLELYYDNYFGIDAFDGYSIDISVNNLNYEIVNTLTYNILPKVLKVNWTEEELYYNGLVQRPYYSITGLLDNETAAETVTDFTNNIVPDNYVIGLVSNNPNYVFDVTATKEYVILKRLLSIENVTAINRVYNGELSVQLQGGCLIGILDGETVTFILGSGIMEDGNAGSSKHVSTDITLTGENAEYYELIQPVLTVDICKAVIDMSGVSFPSQTFAFDGSNKSIAISGPLHESLIVNYTNNENAQVGVYAVTANFILTDQLNFEPVSPMTAVVYIVQSIYDFDNSVIEIADGYIEYGVQVQVTYLTECNYENINDNLEVRCGYNVELLSDNSGVQPDGVLKVRLALSDKILKNRSLAVYYFSDGVLTKIDHSIINGELVFYTDRTGEFIIVTNKNYAWIAVVIILPIAAITVIILSLYFYKKKKIKESLVTLESEQICTDNIFEENLIPATEISEKLPQHEFVFDGIYCKNYDWFMRSLEFKSQEKQTAICAGDEATAKLYEAKPHNTIFWQGRKIRKDKKEYGRFIAAVSEAAKHAEE